MGVHWGRPFLLLRIHEAMAGKGVSSVALLGMNEGNPGPGAGPGRERGPFSGVHGSAPQGVGMLCHVMTVDTLCCS